MKSAILLAGLRGDGRTTVREAIATRDHTERMLRARGVPVDHETIEGGPGAAWSVEGGVRVRVVAERVPADVSAAAFWLVAGAIHPDAELTLRGVGVNPTRRAIVDLLGRMGARIDEVALGDPDDGVGEPLADLTVRSELARGDRRLAGRGRRGDRRDPGALPGRDPGSRPDDDPRAPASCATRNPTGSPGSRPACGRSAPASRSTATTSRSTGRSRSTGAPTDSLDDHRLAMTFAIAGLVARGRTTIEAPAQRVDLVSRLLQRARRGAGMTRRVVLIGHPVAHSLSGAMQQAAFDERGIDATYELWDRPPIELAEAIGELRGDDFLGANVTIPHKEKVVPLVDRLTEEGHATGAVNTITKEGKRLIGHNTDVPGFRVALDKLVGKQKMPRQAVVLGAGGGARAVVYGLITEGFTRVVVFNRHLHRAEALVKHFGRSAAHMELKAMPWHESIIESELAQDPAPRQRDLDRPARRRDARSRASSCRPSCSSSTSSTGGRGCCATPPRPATRRPTASSCSSTRARPRSRCGPVSRRRSS